MRKIKIGQIGVCHEHAAGKITTLRGLPAVFELVGIVDDRRSTSARFAGDDLKPYEGLKWVTEEDLFQIPGLEAVTVETPNHDLVPTALRCLKRGLAIHMDKPGGTDLEIFSQLRRGYEERRLPFQMGYMFRSNPAIQLLQNIAREGWLGDIFEIQASMSHNYGGPAYQAYLRKLPGGIMFNLGCHLIDWVVSILGRPEKVTSFLKSTPGVPEGTHNHCLTILDYPVANVTLRASSMEVNGLEKRCFKVCGTKGTALLSPPERFDGKPLQLSLTLTEGRGVYPAGEQIIDFGLRQDRYQEQLMELAQTIRGEKENPYTAKHDTLVQEVLLAASGLIPWRR